MKVVILAGGSGTRLWPLSRMGFPKQFLQLDGEESFLQKTVNRNLALVAPEDLFIITSKDYYHDVKRQIPILEKNILLEPDQKNTAPAIAFALREIKCGQEEVIVICPSDHLMTPQEKYVQHVKEASLLAQKGLIVTFGVRPTKPETGYGYIKAHQNRIVAFVEKPDVKTAQKFLEAGNYFWNSGMFAFTARTFEEECQKHCPEILQTDFSKILPISLDYALMEKSDKGAVLPLDLIWSDIGCWENVYAFMEKDENQNVLRGDVFTYETCSSLILAEHRHVSTIGLEDILVVETEDAVLVADKKCSQKVKEIVKTLKSLGKKEATEHLTTQRPWGSYTVLMQGARYKIKRILIHPLQKLSLQMHYHRSEHWVVVSGTAKVTLGNKETLVHEGESIFVPKSTLHRVENPGKVALEIIEVQVGEYLGEDDIVRFEDIYGRALEPIKEKN